MEEHEKSKIFRAAMYAGLSQEEYQLLKRGIQRKNRAMLRKSAALGCILLAFLFFASFFVPSLEKNTRLYGVYLILMAVVYGTIRLIGHKKREWILPCYYFFLAVAFSFGIILGTFLQTEVPATSFCVLIFALPLLIIDKPYRITILIIVATIFFCGASVMLKPADIASLDVTNGISFLFLGCVVNYFVLRTKVQEINSRQYIERDRDTDDLTKLLTKAASRRKITEYIAEYEEKAALFVIDIDNFKQVNDTMGHAYGDAVLRIMGQCIRDVFRSTDVLSRFGGDEFVLFIPCVSDAVIIESKVKHLVERMNNELTTPEQAFKITGSIGIAFYPDDALEYDELFKKADEALYESKKKGKNCYTFYFDRNLTEQM